MQEHFDKSARRGDRPSASEWNRRGEALQRISGERSGPGIHKVQTSAFTSATAAYRQDTLFCRLREDLPPSLFDLPPLPAATTTGTGTSTTTTAPPTTTAQGGTTTSPSEAFPQDVEWPVEEPDPMGGPTAAPVTDDATADQEYGDSGPRIGPDWDESTTYQGEHYNAAILFRDDGGTWHESTQGVEVVNFTQKTYARGQLIVAEWNAQAGVWVVVAAFEGPGDLTTQGGTTTTSTGSSLRVGYVDNSLLVNAVALIRLDGPSGFNLAESGPGDADLSLRPAALGSWGVVTTADQYFNGVKTFNSPVVLDTPSELTFQVTGSETYWQVGSNARKVSEFNLLDRVFGTDYAFVYARVISASPGVYGGNDDFVLLVSGRVQAVTRFAVGNNTADPYLGQTKTVSYKKADGTNGTLTYVGGILVDADSPDGTTTTQPLAATTTTTTTPAPAPATTATLTTTTTTAAPLAVTCAANPTSGPANLTVGFTSSPSGGVPGYTYSWASTSQGVTQIIGTAQNFSYTYFNPGTYDVVLTLRDTLNQTTTCSLTVTVTSPTSTTSTTTTRPATTTPHAFRGAGPFATRRVKRNG
jgi:hypothetical protein